MQFQRVNRTNAEQAFGVCVNEGAAVMSGNYPVFFIAANESSNDGYKVQGNLTADLQLFAGIADADIALGAVGLFQCYGYRASVRLYSLATSTTIAAGAALGPGATASNGVQSLGLTLSYGPLVVLQAVGATVNSPGGYAKAFIRSL